MKPRSIWSLMPYLYWNRKTHDLAMPVRRNTELLVRASRGEGVVITYSQNTYQDGKRKKVIWLYDERNRKWYGWEWMYHYCGYFFTGTKKGESIPEALVSEDVPHGPRVVGCVPHVTVEDILHGVLNDLEREAVFVPTPDEDQQKQLREELKKLILPLNYPRVVRCVPHVTVEDILHGVLNDLEQEAVFVPTPDEDQQKQLREELKKLVLALALTERKK